MRLEEEHLSISPSPHPPISPSLAPLRPGQRILVPAAAGPVDPSRIEAGMRLLRQRGFEVQAFLPGDPSVYLAGSDQARAEVLTRALLDPDVDAVWAARGGYGLMRILDRLPWDLLPRARARWVVGFSDICALLLPLAERCPSWGVLHAPNVQDLDRLDPGELEALLDLLEQPEAPRCFSGLQPLRPGLAEGALLAGNLCVLSHLAGSPFLPEAHGCILVLEEVGERPYRIDRMLTQLELCGWFDGVAGLVLGELLGCDEPGLTAIEALKEWLQSRHPRVPAVAGMPVGHGARNRALRLGEQALLDAGAGTLKLPGGTGRLDMGGAA